MPYKVRAVVDVGADVVDLEGEAFEKRRLFALETGLGGPQTLKLEPEQKIERLRNQRCKYKKERDLFIRR